jgi:AcrR family transcriptional regulator
MMPKIVDYEARRREIAAKAVSVFVHDGFHDANLSKIAELCGFGRTTIYKYFKDKDEIFLFALEEIFVKMEGGTQAVVNDASLGAAEKLAGILEVLVRAAVNDKERALLVIDLCLDREPEGLESKTLERAMTLKSAFERVIESGIASGELKSVKPGPMAFALFSLVEAYILQNSLFGGFSYDEAMEAARALLEGLKANSPKG